MVSALHPLPQKGLASLPQLMKNKRDKKNAPDKLDFTSKPMVPVLYILFLALTLLLPFIEMLDVAFLQFLKKPYRCTFLL